MTPLPSSADESDYVSVDMPVSKRDMSPTVASIAAADVDDSPENDVEGGAKQRSLLKTLWSEATSTTDLPSASGQSNHRVLHHRRTTTSATTNDISPSAKYYARKNSNGRRATAGSGAAAAAGGRPHASHGNNRYRTTRGAKIAKRVWLAAFAAFAVSFLIAVHVFLYRVFVGSSSGSGKDDDSDSLVGAVMKNGVPIMAMKDQEVKMSLDEAHAHKLKSITQHPIDTSQYTIRINTWQRNEQLLLSLNHHAKCEGVKEIQIIWCDSNNEPPDEIVNHPSGKAKVEKHVINSLNERFKVRLDSPTLGILSLDDDVLRPCVALDAAFIKWIRHPERMVGFDVRSHVVAEDEKNEDGDEEENNHKHKSRWKYGYMSTTESSNRYSMTLPRASFIHRDYLDLYAEALPREIYKYVAENLECEDIAMSFLVSSLTDGKPPLVADYWAVKSMIKLYSATKISGGKDHKSTRDNCVNDFAELLGLKEDGAYPLQTGKLLHNDHFLGYGTDLEIWSDLDTARFAEGRLQRVIYTMQDLQDLPHEGRMGWLAKQKAEAMAEAKSAGMIDNTEEWKARWENGGNNAGNDEQRE